MSPISFLLAHSPEWFIPWPQIEASIWSWATILVVSIGRVPSSFCFKKSNKKIKNTYQYLLYMCALIHSPLSTFPPFSPLFPLDPWDQVRIKYHFFYSWQPPCMISPLLQPPWYETKGAHQGDWEALTVTLSSDRQRIAAVTYHQHGGWYTRVAGRSGFQVSTVE
jgi:hypothetical protein